MDFATMVNALVDYQVANYAPHADVLAVEDDGPGIAQLDRENALKPFVRLDQSRNQDNAGGVGLGLAIVADVARSHGGTVQLSSSRKLGGLKVTFTIPR